MSLKSWLSPALYSDLKSLRSSAAKVLRSVRQRLRFQKLPNGTELKINLGCGALAREHWINIDGVPLNSNTLALDLRNPLLIADGAAQHIHCEHFLEHLTLEDGKQLLRECFRILRSGGTLRLILPDAEKYLRAYVNDDAAFFERLKNLGNPSVPFQSPIEIINQMFRMGNDHLHAWDEKSLRYYLGQVGFVEIQRSHQHDSAVKFNIDGVDDWRELESIYLNMKRF